MLQDFSVVGMSILLLSLLDNYLLTQLDFIFRFDHQNRPLFDSIGCLRFPI